MSAPQRLSTSASAAVRPLQRQAAASDKGPAAKRARPATLRGIGQPTRPAPPSQAQEPDGPKRGLPAATILPASNLLSASMIASFTGDPNFMTSLARGLSVIQAFSQHSPQMSISQVSVRTGISRAAVRRCLYTLTKLGFVGAEDGRRFSLRPRILSLSHSYTSSNSLAHAAQPILDQLSHLLHESCSVATLDGDEIVYVARANVARLMSVDLGVGSRLPAYCTSMGRIFLAHLLNEELEQYLARVSLQRYTRRTVVSGEKLRLALRNIQRTGFAMVDQELEVGLRSLAVPVKSATGRVIAAMNVGAQAQRMPLHEIHGRFLPQLQAAAHELSLTLR